LRISAHRLPASLSSTRSTWPWPEIDPALGTSMRRRRAQGNLPADSSASRNAGLLDAIYSLPNAGRLLFGVGAETFGIASSALGFGFAVLLWLRTRGRETAP
jgi:hypothetical protein